ncbi:MAG TPA: dihydropteroate synthase [Gemmatimonadales bacterium]|nr:dihydropteroate synthase [Gemmatimonadales bacterium]
MIAASLAGARPRELAEVLVAHGWDDVRAEAAADGLGPIALHLTEVPAAAVEALVQWNARAGLDLLTGPDWVVIAGSRSRVGALARPWTVPEPLAELAVAVGLALPPDAPTEWVMARGTIRCDVPVVVGILNLTPDSFSDGGALPTVEAAVARAERLLADGAAMLDLGGESSRPGAQPVTPDEETARVVPVIRALAERWPGVPLSVDTVKASVAESALAAGAWAVNDVSGFRLDAALPAVVARAGAGAILMHSRGSFSEMATFDHATYESGVTPAVVRELAEGVARATGAGVGAAGIVVDPGFGFSKTAEQNLELLDRLGALGALGRPVLVGPSRKRFLGHVTGRDVHDRDRATAAACVLAYDRGARLFRVHEPAAVRDALAVAHATGGAACR